LNADASRSECARVWRAAVLSEELARLHRRRRDRDHAALLLAILERIDGWFTAHELRTLVPLSPTLVGAPGWLVAEAIGRRLAAIADTQDDAVAAPALRFHCKTSSAATVWKVDT
jgi:hypothetical protein